MADILPSVETMASEIARLVPAGTDGAVGGERALLRLDLAERLAAELRERSDRLIGYFLEHARQEGCSWTDLGRRIGVSRQAAQQRYSPFQERLTMSDLFAAGALRHATARTHTALRRADDQARRRGHSSVSPEHLLLGILEDPNLAVDALVGLGVDTAALRDELSAALPPSAEAVATDLTVGAPARRCFDAALAEALQMNHNYIGTEHLLLGLLRDDGVGARMATRGVTSPAARVKVGELLEKFLPR